jgi:hypothetical protein
MLSGCTRCPPPLTPSLPEKRLESEATRIAAIKEIFDRAIGKAAQPVEGNIDVGNSLELEQILRGHDGDSRSIPRRANGTLASDRLDTEQLRRTLATTQLLARGKLIALVQVFSCPISEAFEQRLADCHPSGRDRMRLARVA